MSEDAMRRIVTDEVELVRYFTRRGAEKVCLRLQAQVPPGGSGEYCVRRKGFMQWAVIGYQVKVMSNA